MIKTQMKKRVFKRNITATVACVITEFLLSLIPAIFIIYLVAVPEQISELPFTLLMIPYFVVIINVILMIVSCIAGVFLKTRYFIEDDCITVKDKYEVKRIAYRKISHITYDFGNLTKFNGEPSQLVLFDDEFNQLLAVKNPSILMTYMIKKRCGIKKLSYYHEKRGLLISALVNGIVLLSVILIKFCM